jgi:Tfp pilus assembly protein PilX
MKSKQEGAVMLMLSHFFLLGALALSMATYQGVLAQYRNVQNQTEYRQHFWMAEAGLECAIAWFSKSSFNETDPIYCPKMPGIQLEWKRQGANGYLVHSSVGNLSLRHNLVVHSVPSHSVSWVSGSWDDYE